MDTKGIRAAMYLTAAQSPASMFKSIPEEETPLPVNVRLVGGYQVSKGWSYRLVLPPIVICSTIPIETDLVSTRYKELALERPPLSPGITPPVEVKCRASQVAPLAAKVVIW